MRELRVAVIILPILSMIPVHTPKMEMEGRMDVPTLVFGLEPNSLFVLPQTVFLGHNTVAEGYVLVVECRLVAGDISIKPYVR